jgi:predicted acylesterase/phospholipase RssA
MEPILSPTAASSSSTAELKLDECDLVMKGGITSGIVYPPVLLKLKEKFRFRNIGGTSAGAIAAAGAAAAEYGRQCGAEIKYPNRSGFQGLQNINEQLGSCLIQKDDISQEPTSSKSNNSCEITFLQNLFQPTTENSALFKMVLEIFTELQKKNINQKNQNIGWIISLLRQIRLLKIPKTNKSNHFRNRTYNPFKRGSFLGIFASISISTLASLVIFFAVTLLGEKPGVITLTVIMLVLGIPLSFIAYFIGGLGLSVIRLFQNFNEKVIKENNFGFCTGMNGVAQVSGEPALTQWLHTDVINNLADPDLKTPLTFGNLRSKDILLRMVTSNVSQNIPYILPFENPIFIFNEDEFRKLFPDAVVDFMKKHPSRTDKILPARHHFLPQSENFPVVVATRMSLSFPVLFSAIPLYTIKASQRDLKLEVGDLQLNWFSDGGISSNFPIHFFDGWIPSRPTFGINLGTWKDNNTQNQASSDIVESSLVSSLKKSVPLESLTYTNLQNFPVNQSDSTYKNSLNDGRVVLPEAGDLPIVLQQELGDSLLSFLGAIFSTSQNYRDTMQSMLAGYRERIVEIKLNDTEGGLNLNMPPEVINVLKELGSTAGEQLCNFKFDHHQWVRLKTMMGLLESQLHQVATAVQNSKFNYQELLNSQQVAEENFPFPEIDEIWLKSALNRLSELDKLIRAWETINNNNDVSGNSDNRVFTDLEPLKTDKSVLRVTPQI